MKKMIYMTEEVQDKLNQLAKLEGMSQSEFIRNLIEREYEQKERIILAAGEAVKS